MANGKLRETLEKALDSLKDAATDLSTIEVTTLSGDVKEIFNGDKIDLKKAITGLKEGSAVGKIELVAHTQIDFDHDTILFISEKARNKQNDLYELHKDAVVSSQDARQGFLRFIKEFLGNDA